MLSPNADDVRPALSCVPEQPRLVSLLADYVDYSVDTRLVECLVTGKLQQRSRVAAGDSTFLGLGELPPEYLDSSVTGAPEQLLSRA
jgi:hypothetical protein